MQTEILSQETLREYNQRRHPSDQRTLCQAPSVNLNFDQNGNATACCYNRRYILGTYPRDSLREIWSNPRTDHLRKLLEQGDLSQGCQLCLHQLQAKNFSGLRAKAFDGVLNDPGMKVSKKLMPRIMEFELSNICNLECIMCNGFFSSSIRKNREKLEPLKNPYDDDFVEQLRFFIPDLRLARFLGGEPFLNPLYYKIWELIIELNPKINVAITTNATVLNSKGRALISKLKPTVVISCDSLDKTTYESIRVNAKFEVFYANMLEFLEISRASGKVMALAVCPMVNNWKTIPDILHFCNENGACLGLNMVVWPPELSIKTLPPKKILQITRFLKAGCPSSLQTSPRWWVRHNYDAYQGMLNQLQLWSTENG